jgi:hypothetical protein
VFITKLPLAWALTPPKLDQLNPLRTVLPSPQVRVKSRGRLAAVLQLVIFSGAEAEAVMVKIPIRAAARTSPPRRWRLEMSIDWDVLTVPAGRPQPRPLPALFAYTVGMTSIQYTVRGIPEDLDTELRREAQSTGRTLNSLVVETLREAKLTSPDLVHDDLDWFIAGAADEEEREVAAMEWLDALPAEPA